MNDTELRKVISNLLELLARSHASISALHTIIDSKWISVDERLPEHQDDVLVLLDDGYMVVMNYYIEEKEWSCSANYPTNITHWMELPTNPIEGEQQ